MEQFAKYLKRQGKKEHVVAGLVGQVEHFGRFLQEVRGVDLEEATCEDVEAFAERAERERKGKGSIAVRGVGMYYAFAGQEELALCASAIREAGMARRRRSLSLREFRGVNQADVHKLAAGGILTAEQMLEAGRTPDRRRALSEQTDVSLEIIVELVKLADLARIQGLAGIRARLYYKAGVDTVAKLATWEPEALRQMLVDFVERTGFPGSAPLPKEAESTVATAKTLPPQVDW